MKDFGEIFHDDRSLTPLPFLDFLERWRNPLLAVLDWSECSEISGAYVRQLRFASYGQQPLIDIKHNAWSALRPLWQFPHDEPIFMSVLKDERSIFVQLKRENLVDQVISYIIAMNTRVWHSQVTACDVPEALAGKRIDPTLFKRLCGMFAGAEALIEKFLSAYRHKLVLTYEQIFRDGMLTEEAAHHLSAVIGTEVRPALLPLRRNTIANREIVANYDELCEIAASVRTAKVAE